MRDRLTQAKHVPSKCFLCSSRRCFSRIVCESPPFDEVACIQHILDLEAFAYAELPQEAMRTHISSSSYISREIK